MLRPMQLALTADDIGKLDTTQKDAVLAALYTALVADGQPSPEELATFESSVKELPWGCPPQELAAKMKGVQDKLNTADPEGKLAFVAAIAANIPGTPLREKLVRSMLAIVSAEGKVSQGEKASVSAFIRVFGFTDDQIAKLRQEIAN